jgi:hypothetical protein
MAHISRGRGIYGQEALCPSRKAARHTSAVLHNTCTENGEVDDDDGTENGRRNKGGKA